jgi:hypothetical protein
MEHIIAKIDSILSHEPEAIRRAGKEYNFEDVYPILMKENAVLKTIRDNKVFLENVPQILLPNLQTTLNQLEAVFQSAAGFNPKGVENPNTERDNIANQVRANYGAFYQNILIPLKILMPEDDKNQEKIRKLIIDAETGLDEIKRAKTDADTVLKEIRGISAQTGVSKFESVFLRQAFIHRVWAIAWGVFVILGGIGMGSYIIWVLKGLMPNGNGGISFESYLHELVIKIMILSILSIVLYFFIRNYNANTHLYTLNKHRANCLKVFKAFIEATEDTQIRDGILMQTTKAIFEAGDTGFISSRLQKQQGFEITNLMEKIGKGT